MNEILETIQRNLGKDLTNNGECPSNCFQCCSLSVGTNIMNFRKLKKILKKEHLEKYLSDDETLWWTCPFLIMVNVVFIIILVNQKFVKLMYVQLFIF